MPDSAPASRTGLRGLAGAYLLAVGTLAALSLAAEVHLSSFGPVGMDADHPARLTYALYLVRHLVAFSLAIALGMAALPMMLAALASVGRSLRSRRPVGSAGTFLIYAGPLLTVGAVVLLAADFTGPAIRRRGLHDAADRMAPLVDAVRRFEREQGRRPGTLRELVPRYVPVLDVYGVRGCRRLEYRGADGPSTSAWELSMVCPNGMLELENFYFRSDGLPRRIGAGELVGEWRYVWD